MKLSRLTNFILVGCTIQLLEAKFLKSPNIVIIIADDLGSDDVSFRGGREILTPNIDALAYHGKILNRLYTPPLCTPSRASLLTGLFPTHTGSQHYVLANNEPWGIVENHVTMSELFQAHGYSTNLVGKWHLGMGRKEFTPTYNGFDYHYGYWGSFLDYNAKRSQMPNSSIGYDFRRNLEVLCTPNDTYVTDLFTQEAERIILDNNGSKPLFLLVSHSAPHTGDFNELMQAPAEEIEKFSYIPDIQRRTYAAMVSKLDESVGRIIHSLGKASRLDNSIVLFYSDNGGPTVGMFNNTGSNWPLRGQKFSPWEGAVRVPAAIWSPLLKKKSSISEQPIYVGDFLPTLAAAANIKIKHKIDGVNVWPHLMSGKPYGWTSKDKETELFETFEDIWNLTSDMNDQYKYLKAHKTEGWPLNNLEPDFLHSLNEIWNLTSYTKDQYNHLMTVEPDGGSLQHKEPEILHMMDEIWNLTSYMRGQYKYILGTTIDGQYDGVLSQRNPNVIDPRDGKYEQTIKSTLTSKALGKYDDKKLSNELIRKLRSKSEIVCPNSGTPCDALSEECLYNIWLDPCEQNNLARHPKYAKILNEMRQRVEFFRSTAVPPKTGGIKPEYGPSRHNCLWSNYLEEAPTDYILQCDYGSPPCQA